MDLGPAQPIDEAVAEWRKAIVARQRNAAAETLRRRVWEPLAQHIPSQTTTVIIAPDGSLTAIPWAALPGDRRGTVLLEQYAIALVPHAPFLLDRLTAPARSRDDAGVVLALGGVAYGQAPKPVDDEKTKLELLAVRQAETQRGHGDGWTELPGTREELETVVHLAAARGVVRLEGTAASTAGLLRALPQARWAHIATHGFFADPTVPSVLRPDPKLFAASGSNRAAPGARNPLVLSGLVLAGANRPSADIDATTHDDLGILTAEAIAGLPLQEPGAGRAVGLRDGAGDGRRRRRGLRAPAGFSPGRGAHGGRQPVEGGRYRDPEADEAVLFQPLGAGHARRPGAAPGAVDGLE